MRLRPHASILLLLSALACERDPHPPASHAASSGASCRSRVGGSRWAGHYRLAASFGDSDQQTLSGIMLAGIAASDSVVYVMESERAALWLLRPDLSVIRRIGRQGQGPGEWRPAGAVAHGGSMRWVSASRTGVRLFDGQRIQEFSPDGRFRRMLSNAAMRDGISPRQSRMAFRGDTVFYTTGGYDVMEAIARGEPPRRVAPVGGRLPWWIRMRVGDDVRGVLAIGLTPLDGPLGPAQARPLWDTNSTCFVASDGAAPLLVYTSLGRRANTLTVPLPDRAARMEDYAEKMGGLLPPNVRLEEPSAPARIRDLVLDPDGYVWLLPVQPAGGISGGVEVIRVSFDGASAVTDTIPAFPRVFAEPGVYFAENHEVDGEVVVQRYESQRPQHR